MKSWRHLVKASPKGRFYKLRHPVRYLINRLLGKSSDKDKVFFFLLNKEQQHRQLNLLIDSYRNKKSKMSNFNRSTDDGSIPSFLMGKIMGAYKNTKESSYVKSLYHDTTQAFKSTDYAEGIANEKPTRLPPDTQIFIYPTFAKHDNGKYVTRVKGVVSASGSNSRKSRFLLSMARRLIRSSDPSDVETTISEFRNTISNPEIYKTSSNDKREYDQCSTVSSNSNDIVKQRMQGILAKDIADTPLNITIGSAVPVDNIVGVNLTSDSFGMFQISITSPYKPEYIAVSSVIDPSIIQTMTVEIVESKGFSVITDIDDTIRLTGILGDKREIFRNLFYKDFTSCEIKGVSEWFNQLHDEYKCSVHYVSNSPWQVFNIVNSFLSFFEFPVTSVHLRQYSGNLIASFTQPSAERKRPSLVALLDEFPERKFILVGDTGEQDLEAYLSLLSNYSPQIVAIYMRVVPKSLSSLGNDDIALKEFNEMLQVRKKTCLANKVDHLLRNPTGIDSNDEKSCFDGTHPIHVSVPDRMVNRRRSSIDAAKTTIATAVKMTRVRKLPPIVPRKPDSLRGEKVIKTLLDGDSVRVVKPSHEPVLNLSEGENRDHTTQLNNYDYENELIKGDIDDKRFILWKQRVQRVIDEVPEHIHFEFWKDASTAHASSIHLLVKELE